MKAIAFLEHIIKEGLTKPSIGVIQPTGYASYEELSMSFFGMEYFFTTMFAVPLQASLKYGYIQLPKERVLNYVSDFYKEADLVCSDDRDIIFVFAFDEKTIGERKAEYIASLNDKK